MNREIKFRAWDGSKMHRKVSALYPLFYREGKYPCRVDDDVKDKHISPVIIMQYTGLKDKNGIEIYEGDILQWASCNPFSLGEIRKIRVNYIQARFWCQGSIHIYLGELLANEKCEVTGNIYENPELINQI